MLINDNVIFIQHYVTSTECEIHWQAQENVEYYIISCMRGLGSASNIDKIEGNKTQVN